MGALEKITTPSDQTSDSNISMIYVQGVNISEYNFLKTSSVLVMTLFA